MTKDTTLQTKRLNICVPTKASFDNRYKLLSDEQITKFLGNGQPKTELEVEGFLQKNIEHYHQYGFCLFDVFLKNTGEFIGDAGLIYEALNPKNKNIEVGYRLLKKHWGKGYATELAEFFIGWGFGNFDLDKIIACCYPDNFASSNVMKKCGMKYQGKYFYNNLSECDIYQIEKIN